MAYKLKNKKITYGLDSEESKRFDYLDSKLGTLNLEEFRDWKILRKKKLGL